MKFAISDLWYGNISLCENCGAGNKEAEALLQAMAQNEEALCAELGTSHRALFQKYVHWSDEYACCISALAFREGFCLACQFLCEAFLEGRSHLG